ncbi:MAG: adenylate/guanylate cyclase domain-containing protein, partial [Bacteroidetes bacterium]|nr:adenylate/guanylate cyclase domain-containing protein [Bacteroidota bacterium]
MAHKPTRKLAAIMFTDMVGYTLLMQKDEQKAKSLRDRHRQVQKEEVESHSGEILQYYGDGTLCIFNSSLEAVDCAIQIQKKMQKKPKIPLRIGIHTGDIVHDQEGIYGDGVNVASRIESFAIPGSVLISEKVTDDIKNHPSFSSTSMGIYELKNVEKPMEVYAITNQPLKVPKPEEIKGKGRFVQKSLAVLPFVNMSADAENEYFSDGITEEILNALAKVDGLQVTARTSSFAFKGKNMDLREIGAQLNVQHILEGSVRKAGNKVRITAQLINSADGYHLWSDTFDRKLEDIFEVQDEISQNIAHQLKEQLAIAKKEPLVKSATKNIEAY